MNLSIFKFTSSRLALLLPALAAGLWSCQNDIDDPDLRAPLADYDPDAVITVAELKAQYWSDDNEYIDTIGVSAPNDPATMKQHPVLRGRVISSDAAGNIYKNLVLQDETGAIALSVNANNMCNKYRPGQEVVVSLDGMYIGKYRGLMQLGFPSYDRNTWQATFMPYEFFEMHAQLNGNPEPARIDTVVVGSYAELSTSAQGLRRWQSQLVRFNNCRFEQGGKATFASSKTTENRTLILADGNSIDVRTSGYSNFWGDVLPEGNFDMVAILSYYNSGSASTGGWQLLLNDRRGCMNVGNPTVTVPLGQEDNPYTVADAIALEQAGSQASGWVTGYIVGAVAPGVTAVSSESDVEFTADVIMDNTLVIGAAPDTRDISQCLVINLPQDSKLRQYGNLVDNPANYRKRIDVKGRLEKVLGTYGVADNRGTAAEFKIEGVEIPGGSGDTPAGKGDGSEASPYGVDQVLALGSPGTQSWVQGYIVGWVEGAKLAEGAHFSVPAAAASNVLIAAEPGCTDPGKCVPVQLVAGSEIRAAVNLMDNPVNLGKTLTIQGSLEKYFGVPGLKAPTAYKLDGSGTPEPPTPPAPSGDAFTGTSANLAGPPSKYYADFTTDGGWAATNSQWLQGGASEDDSANAPTFKFIGGADVFAVCLNGKKGSEGTLTSPLIQGPLKTLSFRYGFPYKDTKCSLTVNILQGGKVVATDKLENASMTQFKAFDYSHEFNVSGDFTIQIVNDGPSGSASNKDRTAVWAITWTR